MKATRAALGFGEMVEFWWVTLRAVARIRRYTIEVLRQSTILARSSTPIIMLLVCGFGLVVGVESAYGARLVGAPSLAALGPAIGGLREVTPYAFAYMMAAKVSTGYVAEIGVMRISDEIDALDVLGLDSVAYVCTTRVLATWIVMPLLFGMAVVVGFAAAYVAVVFQVGQVSGGGYLELFWKFQSPTDLLFAAIKGVAMGTYVTLVGVYYGFRVRGGPVEVGAATARAMVVNLIGIHVIGVLGSQLFWGGNSRFPFGG